MATYKLMQDIEAEDHILGPLSLRQFIFAMIAAFFGYFCYFVVIKHADFLLIIFLPPALFFGFFAFPFGKDQPTEVWFLAKLRFWFLPRRRIWDQSGMKELVTITVPKRVERVLTDGLSQLEVKSRLGALANTIDSRGWAIKNVNAYTPAMAVVGDSERLIDLNSVPQEVPAYVEPASSDMLDTQNNPLAQQVDAMVAQSAAQHHQKLMSELSAPAAPAEAAAPASNNWFMGQGAAAPSSSAPLGAAATPAADWFTPHRSAPAPSYANPPVVIGDAPEPALPSADEAALARELKQNANKQSLAYGHMRTLRPAGEQPAAAPAVPPSASDAPAVTTPSDPAILALASNNDLSVETLARQAHKARDDDNQHPDEVVISLR